MHDIADSRWQYQHSNPKWNSTNGGTVNILLSRIWTLIYSANFTVDHLKIAIDILEGKKVGFWETKKAALAIYANVFVKKSDTGTKLNFVLPTSILYLQNFSPLCYAFSLFFYSLKKWFLTINI